MDEFETKDSSGRAGDASVVRQVFDQLPLRISALDGPDDRYVAMTAAMRAAAGRADLIGRTFAEAYPEATRQGMTEVTHLASTGVAALHRLVELHRDNSGHLRLYAPTPTQVGDHARTRDHA